MRQVLALAVLVLVLALPAPAPAGQSRFHDFGAAGDVDPTQEIHLWPRESLRIGIDPAEFVQYENEDRFYWCTTPDRTRGLISARVVQIGRSVEIRVRSFDRAPRNLHLQIRYKDHLRAPVSVWSWSGGEWTRSGHLAGAADHCWKSAVIQVPGPAVAAQEGTLRFRLGTEDGADVIGEIPIDYVRLAETAIRPEPDAAGYFPEVRPSRFPDIGRRRIYAPEGQPLLPVGILVTATRTDTWRQVADLNVPMISLVGWNNDWRSRWQVRSDGRYVDRVEAGLPEWLQQAEEYGLGHVPAFNTDGFSWFIRNTYGSERDALRAIRNVIRRNRRAPSLLAWIMKTHADDRGSGRGCPLEYALDLANVQREADPDRPTAMTFRQTTPESLRYFAGAADIFVVDHYPIGQGRPVAELAARIDEARGQVGEGRAVWAVVEARTAEGENRMGRQLNAQEILVQGYLALVHGADGVWFFVGSGGAYFDLSELREPREGLLRFTRELFGGPHPVSRYLLPPFRTVDRMGARGVVTTPDPNIHHVVQEAPDGTWRLIAVNASPERRVHVRFESSSFRGDRTAIIEQEDRLIGLTDGALVDNFEGYERHIYRVLPF